ncbi:MAG: Na+/H+ antiporter [Chloroflexota bacterium]
MHEVELTLVLLVAVAVLATLARTLGVPYPILLVVAGLLLAVSPVPEVVLAPDLVFLLFLPPLLYLAAFDTAIRDVRAMLRPILSLSVGLVLATMVAVAVVVRLVVPDVGWPAAFAFGAIVSPPDAVAAVAVLRRLNVPRQLVTLLEGESLFNDATALVAFRMATLAMATSSFSPTDALLRFVVVGGGGVLVGVLVGKGIALVRRHLSDAPVEILVSLLTPFAAYLTAEQLGASGVLATVTTGLCLGWWAPRIMDPDVRLRGRAVWEMVSFTLNGLVFLLIGLQLSTILPSLIGRPWLTTIGLAVLVSAVVILVRLIWVIPAAFGVPVLGHRKSWPVVLISGWAGMRGVVSLATALALPLETPNRDLLLFLTFCVILVTLVGQGLSLPWLVSVLPIADDGREDEQERHARAVTIEAARRRIEQLAKEWPSHLPLVDTLRSQYDHRASHVGGLHVDGQEDGGHALSEEAEQEILEHGQIRRAVIEAEREAVLELRDRGEIGDAVWRRVERDLDLEELRLEA